VGDPNTAMPERQRFRLSAPPPIKALVAASCASFFGVIVLLVWGLRDRGPLLLVIGVGSMIFGVALAAGAFLLSARLRTVIYLDAEGITLIRGRRNRVLRWDDIDQVTLSGARLTLQAKGNARGASVINPRSSADFVFVALMAAIHQRLDASRGYGMSGI
jgi:hypothetical protein